MSNEFITTDSNVIFDEIITSLEASVSEPLYPGDERRIFGEALVPLFVGMYNAMNDAARQKMLRYARGDVLDALGERVGVERIPPTEATTTLRFTLAAAVGENVIIPEGTRATSDSSRYFATTGAAVLTMTAGGADEEDDDSLRERIRVAPSKLSTAGPVNGYKYWAMSADSSIADVTVKSEQETIERTLTVTDGKAYKGGSRLILSTLKVYKTDDTEAAETTDYTADYADDLLTITIVEGGILENEDSIKIRIDDTGDGVVKIYPICEGGAIPDAAVLAKVLAACSAGEVRPLTDSVVVEAPTVQQYDIVLKYYTTAAEESACISTIEGEGGAIDQYNEWQSAALGRSINPDKLRALILAPSGDEAVGATRVEIISPVFTALGDTKIAKFSGTKTITHEVVG